MIYSPGKLMEEQKKLEEELLDDNSEMSGTEDRPQLLDVSMEDEDSVLYLIAGSFIHHLLTLIHWQPQKEGPKCHLQCRRPCVPLAWQPLQEGPLKLFGKLPWSEVRLTILSMQPQLEGKFQLL